MAVLVQHVTLTSIAQTKTAMEPTSCHLYAADYNEPGQELFYTSVAHIPHFAIETLFKQMDTMS